MHHCPLASQADKFANHLCNNGMAIAAPEGNTYDGKRTGPRMELCGTPQETGACDEERSPIVTERKTSSSHSNKHHSQALGMTHSNSNHQVESQTFE